MGNGTHIAGQIFLGPYYSNPAILNRLDKIVDNTSKLDKLCEIKHESNKSYNPPHTYVEDDSNWQWIGSVRVKVTTEYDKYTGVTYTYYDGILKSVYEENERIKAETAKKKYDEWCAWQIKTRLANEEAARIESLRREQEAREYALRKENEEMLKRQFKLHVRKEIERKRAQLKEDIKANLSDPLIKWTLRIGAVLLVIVIAWALFHS